ncbi:uncharacterized protein BP5553_09244 [Venustampulla echinocandica]|uniref:Mtf2-like C-terminal domain-containing protein n=1 Tax=Venustampulla echinocandica TaxID=2656787 RepID=A0A370TC82_9HELO|nr:uncharacterized protein BP5553_09244 [Venustampulla echinocandica]RDL31842.1 hypothetical protein BP5553_09244 [Venustampulla echinocandica]
MAPFLYQTKTLCNIALFKPNFIYRSQSTNIIRRSFHPSVGGFITRGYQTRSNDSSLDADQRVPIRRVAIESNVPSKPRRDRNTRQPTQDDDIHFEDSRPSKPRRDRNTTRSTQDNDIHFEDGRSSKPRRDRNAGRPRQDDDIHFEGGRSPRSRNLERNDSTFNLLDSVRVNEFGEVDDRTFQGQGIPDYSEGLEDSFPQGDDGIDSMDVRGPRVSTITDTEKRAFQKIFEEMFAQNQGSADAPSSFPQMTDSASSPGRAKSTLDAMLQTALEQNAQTRKEKEAVVNRYPPVLRASIAKAIRLTEDDSDDLFGETTTEEPELDHDQLETLRDPERIRVETLMNEAKTDVELFEVMEKEVFSLIQKLGLEETPSGVEPPTAEEPSTPEIPTTTKAKRGRKKKDVKEVKEVKKPVPQDLGAQFETTITDSATGTEVSALILYGPLYPSHLLFGLRLLDRSFAKPSPLALSILPKVRSLGSISHVLGGTTQLYNEILRIYFYRYENFGAVIKTLEEMEVSAVGLDEETLEIVDNILRTHKKVTSGERGPVIQALWSMPEFSAAKFKFWRTKISTAIGARDGFGENAPVVRYHAYGPIPENV